MTRQFIASGQSFLLTINSKATYRHLNNSKLTFYDLWNRRHDLKCFDTHATSQLKTFDCRAPGDFSGTLLFFGASQVTLEKTKLTELLVYPNFLSREYVVTDLLQERVENLVMGAVDKRTGDSVVIKITNSPAHNSLAGYLSHQVLAEKRVLRYLDHRFHNYSTLPYNKPLRYLNDDLFTAIVTPRLDGNTLMKITNTRCHNCTSYKEFAKQLLESLHQIHSVGVIHNDIKSENILMKDDRLYLNDFGSSCTTKRWRRCKNLGTYGFLHPVKFIDFQITEKVDIFSFAITILEFIIGRPVFPSGNEVVYLGYLAHALGEPNRLAYKLLLPLHYKNNRIFAWNWNSIMNDVKLNSCPELLALIKACLKWEVSDIPSAKDLLDRFFSDIPRVEKMSMNLGGIIGASHFYVVRPNYLHRVISTQLM